MAKDISQYIDFKQNGGLYPTRSIRSLIGLPCVVYDWQEKESRYRDGNPSGKYVQLHVEVESGHFLVNTGSAIIMDELEQIQAAKEQEGDDDLSFSCIVKRAGRGLKMYPVEWERKDVSAQERKEERRHGCPDQGQ